MAKKWPPAPVRAEQTKAAGEVRRQAEFSPAQAFAERTVCALDIGFFILSQTG